MPLSFREKSLWLMLVSLVAVFGFYFYSSVVFAGLLEWALWKSVPDALSIVGMIVVAAAGVLALRIGAEAPQPGPAP